MTQTHTTNLNIKIFLKPVYTKCFQTCEKVLRVRVTDSQPWVGEKCTKTHEYYNYMSLGCSECTRRRINIFYVLLEVTYSSKYVY